MIDKGHRSITLKKILSFASQNYVHELYVNVGVLHDTQKLLPLAL
jgi:hypothetical protein